LRPVWALALALSLFAAITVAVIANANQSVDVHATHVLDVRLSRRLARAQNGRLVRLQPASRVEAVSELLDKLGNIEVTGAAAAIVAASIWRHSRRRAATVLLAFAAATAIETALRIWLRHPSPGGILSAYYYTPENSYPSGHALRTVFVAVSAGYCLSSRWMLFAGLALALLVSLSKIYLGNHWLSDVAGGAALGWAAAEAAFAQRRPRTPIRAPVGPQLGHETD